MRDQFEELTRKTYCLLGIPIDNVAMPDALDQIEAAINAGTRFLVATPNVNFIVNAASDPEFKKTLIFSDLCLPDGMWLVRLGRMVGIPIEHRVAGADLLEGLKARRSRDDPVKLCFFGGSAATGERAREAINARDDGLRCVGAVDPGFGSVEEMSEERLVSSVNSSQADFLLVALGAKKGQTWLHANHARLTAPVRAHLGATINFYAGAIKRAPQRLQDWGFEWAWRIKEEPHLWRRYAYDAAIVALMFVLRVLPLLMWASYLRLRRRFGGERLRVDENASQELRKISLAGALTAANADAIAAILAPYVDSNKNFIVDLSGAQVVDARFAGLLWLLHKAMARRGRTARIEGAPILIRWLLALYGFEIPARAPEDTLIPANSVLLGAAD